MPRSRRARRKRPTRMAGSRRSPPKCSDKPPSLLALAIAAMVSCVTGHAAAEDRLVPYTVVGDAIPEPLTGARGDAARGRAIVGNRQGGVGLLCPSGPVPGGEVPGAVGPTLHVA